MGGGEGGVGAGCVEAELSDPLACAADGCQLAAAVVKVLKVREQAVGRVGRVGRRRRRYLALYLATRAHTAACTRSCARAHAGMAVTSVPPSLPRSVGRRLPVTETACAADAAAAADRGSL